MQFLRTSSKAGGSDGYITETLLRLDHRATATPGRCEYFVNFFFGNLYERLYDDGIELRPFSCPQPFHGLIVWQTLAVATI